MLMSTYTNFGYGFGEAPSLSQLIEIARLRSSGTPGLGYYGFGAAFVDDFAGFLGGGIKATFKDAEDIVYCNKDQGNRPQCVLNRFVGAEARRGPVADMQRAADRIMSLIPTNKLAGRQLRGQVPSGDGSTQEQTFTIPDTIPNPIGTQTGYDGTTGESTMHFTTLALTLAGMLKAFPGSAISLAFVRPERTDIYTKYSAEIASYLNDVADNFKSLLDAFNARGNVPVQTQLDEKTIPFVVPIVGQKKGKAKVIVGTAAAMIGLTAVAAVSAAKKKPAALYEESYRPALGRRRRSSRY